MLIKDHGRTFRLKAPKTLKLMYVSGKRLGLVANKKFIRGSNVIPVSGSVINIAKASQEAIQIDKNKAIDSRNYVLEDFINHSCSPNTKLDIKTLGFVAIRNIKQTDEITYNYLTTEWDMKKWRTDFICACNSKKCVKNVRGFRYLSSTQKHRLRPLLSHFLLDKL